MISHKYEDYANRLGIHILDALTAVLLWPAVVVVALWAWRGVPTIYGATSEGLPALAFVVAMMTAGACVAELVGRKLTWYNFPFALDDPRRALAYPYAIYLLKFVMLSMVLLLWQMLIISFAPQLEPYRAIAFWMAFAIMMFGLPSYTHRITMCGDARGYRSNILKHIVQFIPILCLLFKDHFVALQQLLN